MFKDRIDAGQKLTIKLERYRGSDAVVLALPRGGVVLGYEIASVLKLPLDIVVARKIGHPDSPEYAIAAVDDVGNILRNEKEISLVDKKWLDQETKKQQAEAKRRVDLYRGGRKIVSLAGKTVIIVDDGVATGLTLKLAIVRVKKQKPKRLIVAVPVIPPNVATEIEKMVDEIVALEPANSYFGSVGAYYERFEQVEDEEVIRLLQIKRQL